MNIRAIKFWTKVVIIVCAFSINWSINGKFYGFNKIKSPINMNKREISDINIVTLTSKIVLKNT